MKKVQMALVAAAGVALALIWGANTLVPASEEWLVWGVRGVTAVLGLFTLSAAFLLLNTFATVADNLWDTWYFRYMRAFWGNAWGGPAYVYIRTPGSFLDEKKKRPLHISVCKATWLSVIPILGWIAILSLTAVSYYLTGLLLFGSGELIVTILTALQFDTNLSAFSGYSGLLLSSLLLHSVLACFLLMCAWRDKLATLFRFSLTLFWVTAVVSAIAVLVVAPLRFAGIDAYLQAILIVLLVAIGLVLAVIFVGGVIVGVMEMSRTLSEHTVFGVLARGQVTAWKKNVCPLIMEPAPQEPPH